MCSSVVRIGWLASTLRFSLLIAFELSPGGVAWTSLSTHLSFPCIASDCLFVFFQTAHIRYIPPIVWLLHKHYCTH
jgi:hypothetical protein